MIFLTIRQEAQQGIVPEHRLRQMLKQKALPGFYAGTRFYVNHEQFVAQLEAMSADQAKVVR